MNASPPSLNPKTYEPVNSRVCHRVTAIYSILKDGPIASSFGDGFRGQGRPISDHLKFDRLDYHYRLASPLLPLTVSKVHLGPERVTTCIDSDCIERAVLWLHALHYGAFALGLTIDIRCDIETLIPLSESLHHKTVRIDGKPLWEGSIVALGDDHLVGNVELGPDVYQLIVPCASDHRKLKEGGQPNHDLIASLIYRYPGEYRNDTLRVRYPPEPNRSNGLAATGPYVGVISGHQSYFGGLPRAENA